jgi:2-amino-4-hydroxy-6-hydroxymethyldihydropteridine diphosphokinase
MQDVYLSIGSNIEPERYIPAALKDLEHAFGPMTLSSIYETEAVGFEGPPFHNLVAGFKSKLDPKEIASTLRHIESCHGRSRNSQKFSSRTLDVDLILYGQKIIREGLVNVPREEITKYAFVLQPLAEIAGTLQHPETGKSYAELWNDFSSNQTISRISST